MSANCFPDQVSAPLASPLMIRSTVRWTRNRVVVDASRQVGVVVQLGESCTCHDLPRSAKDESKDEFTAPYHSVKWKSPLAPLGWPFRSLVSAS